MSTSDIGVFRRRQAIADLNRQLRFFPLAIVRRIGAGLGVRDTRAPNLERRLQWYFSGKAPIDEVRRDSLVHGALLMASALPEDDFESFLAATALLLLERLTQTMAGSMTASGTGASRPPLPARQRPVPCAPRSCAASARRGGSAGLTSGRASEPEDCLTRHAGCEVLNAVACSTEQGNFRRFCRRDREMQFRGRRIDARRAGELWADVACRSTPRSAVGRRKDDSRGSTGLRYLYERPASIDSFRPRRGCFRPDPGSRTDLAYLRAGSARHGSDMDKEKRPQKVYTLVVEVGRKAGDGCPQRPPARRSCASPRAWTRRRPCARRWRS
jgi:hypothetical protein